MESGSNEARWGVLEVLGHQTWGGLIREVQDVGGTWIEVVAPAHEVGPRIRGGKCIPGHVVPERRKLFAPHVRFALEWTSEENAREHLHNPLPFDGPDGVPMPELAPGHRVHVDFDDVVREVLRAESDGVVAIVEDGGWVRPQEIVAIYDAEGNHVWGLEVRKMNPLPPALPPLVPAAWEEPHPPSCKCRDCEIPF